MDDAAGCRPDYAVPEALKQRNLKLLKHPEWSLDTRHRVEFGPQFVPAWIVMMKRQHAGSISDRRLRGEAGASRAPARLPKSSRAVTRLAVRADLTVLAKRSCASWGASGITRRVPPQARPVSGLGRRVWRWLAFFPRFVCHFWNRHLGQLVGLAVRSTRDKSGCAWPGALAGGGAVLASWLSAARHAQRIGAKRP